VAEEFSFKDLLAAADKSGFSNLPVSEYDVRIDSAEVRQTATGKQKITVKYKVLGGPYANRVIFNDMVLSPGSPNAMAIFFRQMAAMGLDSAYFSQDPSLSKVAADLADREMRILTENRTWQGVERMGVAKIMPAAQGSSNIPGGNGNGFAPPPPPSLYEAPLPAASSPPPPPPPAPAMIPEEVAAEFGAVEIVEEDDAVDAVAAEAEEEKPVPPAAPSGPPAPPPGMPF
jgi:Protein of unknown function (DUF669)